MGGGGAEAGDGVVGLHPDLPIQTIQRGLLSGLIAGLGALAPPPRAFRGWGVSTCEASGVRVAAPLRSFCFFWPLAFACVLLTEKSFFVFAR